jgi:hypothetical protein
MFGRRRKETTTEVTDVRERPIAARGGVSLTSVVTGALVAIGAFSLFSAIVGAVLATSGVTANELAEGRAVDAGVAGGIALLVALFLAFLWGGYTAGRMGRGLGFVNGLLVPIGVLILLVIVGAIVWAFGASQGFELPSVSRQIPIEGQYQDIDFQIGILVATLAVIFAGGILGGMLGSRWHTKLERRAETDRRERVVESRAPAGPRGDEREREHAPAATRSRETAPTETRDPGTRRY